MGGGGQTLDLSPHGCVVICRGCRFRPGALEGSSATQRQWLLPVRSQRNKKWLPPGDTVEKDCVLRFVSDYFIFFFFVVQGANAFFLFFVWCLVQLLRKGSISTVERWGERRKTGWGGSGELIRNSANSTEMAVVIQLSPRAVKILGLSLGVYLLFLCQNCPPCTQVD